MSTSPAEGKKSNFRCFEWSAKQLCWLVACLGDFAGTETDPQRCTPTRGVCSTAEHKIFHHHLSSLAAGYFCVNTAIALTIAVLPQNFTLLFGLGLSGGGGASFFLFILDARSLTRFWDFRKKLATQSRLGPAQK